MPPEDEALSLNFQIPQKYHMALVAAICTTKGLISAGKELSRHLPFMKQETHAGSSIDCAYNHMHT